MNESLRQRIQSPEFDYQALLDALAGYTRPRDKITSLLRKGAIIRVKKGLYVFGDDGYPQPYSREILANLIYGPSYISLEYALQYYGLIPERVEAVTSVTVGRSRTFHSPVGLFIYRMIPLVAFQTGIDRIEMGNGRSFLIAVPEKALADKLRFERAPLASQRELQVYLSENLRVDPVTLQGMSPARLEDYAGRYRSRKILLLSKLIRRLGENAHA